MYKRTGDRKILEDNYQMMQRGTRLLGRAKQTTEEQQTGAYAKYTVLNGLDYGEWCEPGITPMQAMMNPRKSVGTAYLAYSGRLLAEIAQALGKAEDAAQYRDTAEKAVKAYRDAFTDNGKITSDRQCEYVRAIAFAMLGEDESKAAAETLNRMVAENGYHLNTGFPFHALPLRGAGNTAMPTPPISCCYRTPLPAGSMKSSRAPRPFGKHGRALTKTVSPTNP